MKIAYLGYPQVGGTFAVFTALREGLAAHAFDVCWLDVGDGSSTCSDERLGYFVSTKDSRGGAIDERHRAVALIDHLAQAQFDAVLINVFVSPLLMAAMRYLPAGIARVMIVHSTTHATYQAARALRDYVHTTVGVNERIRDDLVRRFGFSPLKTHVIVNAVTPSHVADSGTSRAPNAILSLGRLEDASKGILQLPRIFDREVSKLGTLSIAGDGPDRKKLARAFRVARVEPRWLGLVPPKQVAEIYASHAIFLFPSRFEGLPVALAEAMASGLAPIAARIPRVTEDMIQDGISGYLFDQGDLYTARARLLTLLHDRQRLDSMRQAAAQRARSLFGLERMAQAYAAILNDTIQNPSPVPSLSIEQWSIPRRMRPGIRAFLPQPVRRRLGNFLLNLR